MKKQSVIGERGFAVLLALILAFSIIGLSNGAKAQTIQSWTIEDHGGHFSQSSDGTSRLWSDGGTQCPGIKVIESISPSATFSFSLQVRQETAESFEIFIVGKASDSNYSFEYGHYGSPQFLVAKGTWSTYPIAYGTYHRWYTMQLTVYKDPFKIEAEVFDQDGTLLGTYSASDTIGLTFADISAIGFGVWGFSPSDYSVKNVTGLPFNPTQISLMTSSTSTNAGSAVNIAGSLTNANGTALANRTVVLSCSLEGTNEWIPISSDLTDEAGKFEMKWINSASGTFTLKADWNGDITYAAASNSTKLSFAAYQSQLAFVVESNSTVSSLLFDTASSELRFAVSGEPGTQGFVKVTVAKNLVSDCSGLRVSLDGKQVNYSLIEEEQIWILMFSYSHSEHNIAVYMGEKMSTQAPPLTPSPISTLTPLTTPTPSPSPTLEPSPSASVPEFPAWTILPLAGTTAVAVLVYFSRRRAAVA